MAKKELKTKPTVVKVTAKDDKKEALASALKQLEKLKNCEIHSTVILSDVDEKTFQALGMHVTCEPQKGTCPIN